MIIYWLLGFLFFKENIFMLTPIVLGMIYNFWCFSQLFKDKKIFTKIGLIILSYFIFLLSIIIPAFIYGIILKVLNWVFFIQ